MFRAPASRPASAMPPKDPAPPAPPPDDRTARYMAAHEKAVAMGLHTYKDPETGYTVFTALSHLERGDCCGRGCRHCPFGHRNVPEEKKKAMGGAQKPYLGGKPTSTG
ncbi:hypothetical protein DFJ74DRAFT_707527 [Hyaloraphidium curvatum]|nr:hypothetical protein DFJ74DRAFT_707527 [Hyaloraphidium curvatum]